MTITQGLLEIDVLYKRTKDELADLLVELCKIDCAKRTQQENKLIRRIDNTLKPYSPNALAETIECLLQYIPEIQLKSLRERFLCIEHIEEFGPLGPVGIGLGKFGGHAV